MAQTRTVGTEPDDYDAMRKSPLVHELWARAMGDEYPSGVEPTSCCSWWLLGNAVSALRLRPGARLVDLGCGRGGPGLWLARALSVRLTGIDFSAERQAQLLVLRRQDADPDRTATSEAEDR